LTGLKSRKYLGAVLQEKGEKKISRRRERKNVRAVKVKEKGKETVPD